MYKHRWECFASTCIITKPRPHPPLIWESSLPVEGLQRCKVPGPTLVTRFPRCVACSWNRFSFHVVVCEWNHMKVYVNLQCICIPSQVNYTIFPSPTHGFQVSCINENTCISYSELFVLWCMYNHTYTTVLVSIVCYLSSEHSVFKVYD